MPDAGCWMSAALLAPGSCLPTAHYFGFCSARRGSHMGVPIFARFVAGRCSATRTLPRRGIFGGDRTRGVLILAHERCECQNRVVGLEAGGDSPRSGCVDCQLEVA